MRIGVVYHHTHKSWNLNIWDDIQTLWVINFLQELYGNVEIIYINREEIHLFKSQDPLVVVMQGWWMHCVDNWPPSDSIIPLFIWFHLSSGMRNLLNNNPDQINYFHKYAPIGCRDISTLDFFRKNKVDAYFSWCMSIFQKPSSGILKQSDLTFCVDAEEVVPLIPSSIATDNLVCLSHKIWFPDFLEGLKIAQKLIDIYHSRGKFIITSRLHCALPCISLGLPVIVFLKNRKDPRLELLREYTNNIYFLGYLYPFFSRFSIFMTIFSFLFYKKISWELRPDNNLDKKRNILKDAFKKQLQFLEQLKIF